MAVVEYMLHKDHHRRLTPDFIGDRGHWFNPIDNTYVGWVEDTRDYYVPESIVTLTKEQFVTRALAIHAAHPMIAPSHDEGMMDAPLSNEEVTSRAESWYDSFVAKNAG